MEPPDGTAAAEATPYAGLAHDPVRFKASKILSTDLKRGSLRRGLDDVLGLWTEDGWTTTGRLMQASRVAEDALDSTGLDGKIRTLRYDIEREKVRENQRFLAAMTEMETAVNRLETHLSHMTRECTEARERYRKSDEACRPLIDQINVLYQRQEKIAEQRAIAEAFLAHFTLTAAETALLTAPPSAPVTQDLIDALIKSRRIHEDCKTLLVGDNHTAGLSIMEQMTSCQKQCYDHLTLWFEQEIQSFSSQHYLDVRPLQRQVVDQLRRSPVHLEKMISALVRVRRQALLTSFETALVRGSETGARPMEMHAHEPARYVGDMLAWIHQALANEREFLDALMGKALTSSMPRRAPEGGPRPIESDAQERVDEQIIAKRLAQASISQDGTEEWGLQALVDQNIALVMRPFRLRMQQIITTQQGNLALHKIANIIRFYKGFITNTLGQHSSLGDLLQELAVLANATFFKEISRYGEMLLSSVRNEPVLPTLEPSTQILQYSHLLREVVTDHKTWLPAAQSDDNDELEQVIQAIFANACKLIQYCQATLPDDAERAIYFLNCLQMLENAFSGLTGVSATLDELNAQAERQKDGLLQIHFQELLTESGLAVLYNAMSQSPKDSILSHCRGCETRDVSMAMKSFTAFLSTVDPSMSPRLQRLLSSATASSLHRRALRQLSDRYQWIVDHVLDPVNRYEFATTLIQVDPLEAASLLGVSGS